VKKCKTSLVAAGIAVGLTAFASGAPAQPAAGAQPAGPTTQPEPAQQPLPGEEPALEPSSSLNGPSATTVAPKESSAASPQEAAPSATGPDARSSVTMAGPPAGPDRRLAALTPAGMSTEQACMGFKSIVECAAAMHAAQNLSIPFDDLKSKLTGGQKLGVAIHGLKPEADAPAEASRAENQARSDVNATQG
jgi:hypothetical protein